MRSALTLAFFLAACGGSSKPASTTPASDEQEAISYEDAPPDEGSVDETAVDEEPPVEHAAWPSLGVPECDELLTKTHCSFEKAGDAIPPETWKAMDDSIPAWIDALGNPQTRQATIDACKQSLDAAKDGFAAQGC